MKTCDPKRRYRTVCLFSLVWIALLRASPGFALGFYIDPPGYPSAWPAALASQAYTAQGVPQFDRNGQADGSKGATPQSAADFSSGPANNQPSFFYYGNGGVLYFRLRVNGPPLALTGSGQPFTSITWNLLLDTDGDGYKEFVVMLDGTDSGAQPDDIVIIYDNAPSQRFVIGQKGIWRQDAAGPSDGVNGAVGTSSAWDVDADPYVWDFRRSRVVQIDRSKAPGNQNSEYLIDIQVPLSALDASAVGGPALAITTPFSMSATTSNSNTDPTQKDLLYAGDFALADAPVPAGDLTSGTGNILQAPLIPSLAATACPSPIWLTATVLDATTVDPVTRKVKDTLAGVSFDYYADNNGDGRVNDGGNWATIGPAGRTATLGQWQANWNIGLLANGQYLVRATATDIQGNTTTSSGQPLLGIYGVTATVSNTCSQVVSFDRSAKTAVDVNGNELVSGDILAYTINVRNSGGINALSTVVRDTLPVGTSYVPGSAAPAPAATGPALVWNIGTIAPGQTAVLTFQVTAGDPVPGRTEVRNTAWIASGTVLKSVSASIPIALRPRISLVKSVSGSKAAPGDTLVYTVTYANIGNAAATGVVVRDGPPAATSYIPNTVMVHGVRKTDAGDDDGVTVVDSDITVTIGAVPIGGTGEIRYSVRVR